MDLFDLSGEVAIVTGAGSGIGKALGIGLATAGAHVACFGHSSGGGLEETAGKIEALGRRALALVGTVTAEADLSAAMTRVEQELGPLSIAVNNAGIGGSDPAETMPAERWERIYEVNVKGVFLSCQAQARPMLARGKGSIVNIASISGSIVNRGLTQAHYNSSKAAVIHLSKSLAMEWCQRGVRVNVVSPGYTLTPMNQGERNKVFAAATPMGRLAEPEEMVGPTIFLASRASSFVTGLDVIVDGGLVCW